MPAESGPVQRGALTPGTGTAPARPRGSGNATKKGGTNMKRKIISLAAAAVMLFACFAAPAGGEALPAGSEQIGIPVFTEETMEKYEIPDTEGLRFTRKLKAGWNLGNTFDAKDDGVGFSGRDYETYWSGARTTRELIRAVHEAGFNFIRMPVSWHNHVTDADYTVDPAWMARIKEVADWILDEGMYVIINIHHDNEKDCLYPSTSRYEQSEKYVTAIWRQVCKTFADYDDRVIFESMNEPRLVGHETYEWWLNMSDAQCRDAVNCINRLNQAFVDTVRSSGGQNAGRYLLVPGYCAAPDWALIKEFKLPEDTVPDRIMVEVHAYTPYNYALNKADPDSRFDLEKDAGKKKEIADFMTRLYNRYIRQGIPVVIDECGAMRKNTGDLQDRVNFTAFYVASASARGITCCWWDNHVFTGNGERFGIIDRKKIEWKYPDIALAILENCGFNREE